MVHLQDRVDPGVAFEPSEQSLPGGCLAHGPRGARGAEWVPGSRENRDGAKATPARLDLCTVVGRVNGLRGEVPSGVLAEPRTSKCRSGMEPNIGETVASGVDLASTWARFSWAELAAGGVSGPPDYTEPPAAFFWGKMVESRHGSADPGRWWWSSSCVSATSFFRTGTARRARCLT